MENYQESDTYLKIRENVTIDIIRSYILNQHELDVVESFILSQQINNFDINPFQCSSYFMFDNYYSTIRLLVNERYHLQLDLLYKSLYNTNVSDVKIDIEYKSKSIKFKFERKNGLTTVNYNDKILQSDIGTLFSYIKYIINKSV